VIGQNTTLEVSVEATGGKLGSLNVRLEQAGEATALFDLASPTGASVQQDTAERMRLTRPIGSRAIPSLKEGPVRLIVQASRPVLFGIRTASSTVSVDLQARLTPPQVNVMSNHHFVNHGGAELVIYRAMPAESVSGVRVGDRVYPGYPASGLGVVSSDPSLKACFFALLDDQDLTTPVRVFARDEAGNETFSTLDAQVFPRKFRNSRIEVTDTFMANVMPDIVMHAPELGPIPASPEELLAAYLKANRELRQTNAERIRSVAAGSGDRAWWSGSSGTRRSSRVSPIGGRTSTRARRLIARCTLDSTWPSP